MGIEYLERLQDRIFDFGDDFFVRRFTQNVLNNQKYRTIILEYIFENLQAGMRPDMTMIEKIPVGKQESTRYERYTLYLKGKRYDLTPSSPVTLKDYGDWYDAMQVRIGYEGIIIYNANYGLTDILVSVWSEDKTLQGLIGLTGEQIIEFSTLIQPGFKQAVTRYIKQGFLA